MKTAKLLEPTLENVERVLTRSYLQSRRTDQPSLYVYEGIEMPTWVAVNAERQAICMTTYVELDDDLRRAGHGFLSASNGSYLFPTFFMRGENLCARYALDVTYGFQAALLVVALRRFSAGFAAALRECTAASTATDEAPPRRLHS